MLIDGRRVADHEVVDTDVCIIGAGAAGIPIALALRGEACRVVLLESGTERPNPSAQALYRGKNAGREYFTLDGCRVRTFGGSTQRWGGWCRALDAADFAARPWAPDGEWPFGLDQLEPYFHRARELCQLPVTDGDLDEGPPLPGRPRLPLPPQLKTVLYEFSPPTRFGPAYRHDLVRAGNVTVYLSSNVVALEDVDDAGRVHTAVVRTVAGREWRVRAKTFVLAAGGIENPRILLASCDARPQGLGNENDLVGRYFMEHLHVRLGCFVPTRAVTNLSLYTEGRRSVRRPVGALCVAPAEREARRLFGLSATLIRPQHRSVPEVLAHQARGRAPWTLHGMSIARGGALGFGLRVVDKVIRTMINARGVSPSNNPNAPPPVYEVMARGEQTPLRDSRVTILTERDRLGMPMPQLDWRVNPADLQSLRRNLETMGEGLAAAGAGTLYLPDDPETAWAQRIMGSWHHIGTTRMHTDPRRGVVDAEGRVHSSPNVFVTGSSVFPTGGFANPTLTIIALALRLSDQVIRDLRGQALRATVTH